MSAEHFYHLCKNQYMNKPVEVRMLDGGVHRGIVSRVDREHVWLRPLDDGIGRDGGIDGPGMFFWWWGWGFPLALAGIAGIAALSALWFW